MFYQWEAWVWAVSDLDFHHWHLGAILSSNDSLPHMVLVLVFVQDSNVQGCSYHQWIHPEVLGVLLSLCNSTSDDMAHWVLLVLKHYRTFQVCNWYIPGSSLTEVHWRKSPQDSSPVLQCLLCRIDLVDRDDHVHCLLVFWCMILECSDNQLDRGQ